MPLCISFVGRYLIHNKLEQIDTLEYMPSAAGKGVVNNSGPCSH